MTITYGNNIKLIFGRGVFSKSKILIYSEKKLLFYQLFKPHLSQKERVFHNYIDIMTTCL